MDEEEHEVYGGEIPDEGEDIDPHNADDDAAVKDLDEKKKRLKDMGEEAAALRKMQAKVEKEMGAVQADPANTAAAQASREEVDSRSIFVGNVMAKRTNVPGMKQYRPRRFNPYLGYRFRRPYVPPYFYSPYGYGKVPRFRRPMRYMPYH